MNELTLKDLEELCKQVKFPTIQTLGNGLYRIVPVGIICGDKFLEELDRRVLNIVKEYNTNTSIPHSKKNEDIVRPACITNKDAEITG